MNEFMGDHPIFEAIRVDELDRAGQILDDDPGAIHAGDLSGQTVVHATAATGSSRMLRLLLEAGAEPDAVDRNGYTPLGLACIASGGLVERLLDAGADPNGRGGVLPLHLSAMFGGPGSVDRLLDRGADIDAVDEWGRTALHVAFEDINWRTARHLWRRGIRRDLFGAAALGRRGFLGAALAEDPRAVDARDGREDTPLHWACRGARPATARWLLRRGADPNARNRLGGTPLLEAVGSEPLVATLIAFGADVNLPDFGGNTPLHLAASWRARTEKLLLAAGARADARDFRGRTPSDCAAESTRPLALDGEPTPGP